MRDNPKIDRDAPAWRVASLWGSNFAFARAIGKRHTTTLKWLERGSIHPDYHEAILAAAKRDKKPLKLDDFLDKRIRNVPPAPAIGATA